MWDMIYHKYKTLQDYFILRTLLHSWLKPSELRNVPVIKRDINYRLKLKVCLVKVYSTASLNQDNDSTFSLPESRKEVNLQLILQEDHHYCAPNIKSEKGWSGIQSDKTSVNICAKRWDKQLIKGGSFLSATINGVTIKISPHELSKTDSLERPWGTTTSLNTG